MIPPKDNDTEEPKIGGFYISQVMFASYSIPAVLGCVLMYMGINIPEWFFVLMIFCISMMSVMMGGVPGYIFMCTGKYPFGAYNKYIQEIHRRGNKEEGAR